MPASPDDILGMAFFARVVEARSFSLAARTLGVSKSAVSARVARLEEKLGVRLLHRTTRRLALTADGVRLYELCARILADADEAAEVAAGASAIPRGTLRVHAPAGFAESYLTIPIGEFMQVHAGVRIDLRLSDHVPERAAEQFDIAIVIAGRLTDSSLTTRKLARVRMVVCAAPDYLRRKGIPFRPQDLVHHDCLSHSLRQGADDLRFQTDEGAVSITSLSHLAANDTRFLREAALAGLGVTMLPELLVVEDLKAGRLHLVLDDVPTNELAVHAIHPHGRLAPASVRVFLDHLAKYFRRPPWEADGAAAPIATTKSMKPKRPSIAMTEQDVRRLTAVVALYADVDAASELGVAVLHAKTTPAAEIPRTAVTMRSQIRVKDDNGEERELSLVYPWDAGKDCISVVSALGVALLGASVGTKIATGRRTLTIRSIPYQPEAAGDHHL